MAVQKKINWMRLVLAIVLVVAGGYWIANNLLTFFNIMLVVLGFGKLGFTSRWLPFAVRKRELQTKENENP